MKNAQKIEKKAIYWYVRLNSPNCLPEEQAKFHDWLNSAPEHQAAFVRIDQAWSAGSVIQGLSYRKADTRSQANYWVSATAVLLLGFLFIYFTRPAPESNQTAEYYTAPHNQQKTIELNDGSTLILHTNSVVSAHYTNELRELHLHRGQIFLLVTQDSERPFRVHTDQGIIRVIGTQFAIQKLANDLKITVVEGIVGLLKLEGNSNEQKPVLVLSKNQQILYSEALQGAAATSVDAVRETSWTTGRIVFEGTPLSEVLASINPHLQTPIEVFDAELAQKRIVGAISIQDATTAAKSLAGITGATLDNHSNPHKLILTSKSE